MDTWRITAVEQDVSNFVLPFAGDIGATVIRAKKGPEKPIFISKNQPQKIINYFGKPSVDFPDVWEVLNYNVKAGLWVSAPSKNGLYGGCWLTNIGTKSWTSGLTITEINNLDFSRVPVREKIGVGDGVTTTFTYTLTDKSYYVNQSIDILINGVSININATDDATEVLTSSSNIGNGSYTRSSGVLSFTFNMAPLSGDIISVSYKTNINSITYGAIYTKNPQIEDTYIKVSKNPNNVFNLGVYIKDGNIYREVETSPYSFSFIEGAKDGFGSIIYIDNVLRNDDYISFIINKNASITTYINDTDYKLLKGSDRGDPITIEDITRGWNYFKQKNVYPADIFFDVTALPGVASIFVELRNSYQKYKDYILPLPRADATTIINAKNSLNVLDRGIKFYCNWFKVEDNYTGNQFWTTLIGRVAGNYASTMAYYKGPALMWEGFGQLNTGVGRVLESYKDFSETELKLLDEAGINAISITPEYGIMIMSQKTSLNTPLSDYSYIGHSRVADYIIDNILKYAIPIQIGKLNNSTNRMLVKSKVESIIQPLLVPPYDFLRDFVVQCDEKNNDDLTLSQRKFKLKVVIKFTPYSEEIQLTFVNVGQQTDVEEMLS